MKSLSRSFTAAAVVLSIYACKKEQPTVATPTEVTAQQTGESLSIKVENLKLTEDDLGMGCITEYYKKGSKNSDHIYTQTGAKNDQGWVNYMMINGKKEVFLSTNEDAKSNADGTGFTQRLENQDYIIEIDATIGETHIETDSAMAFGTIKIIRKSDNSSTTIEFEGGSAC